ncbi:hypothetical protein Leryth_011255 [Lithospermum erythrorhizon]|nr:hypothetical protein Leryth_011255 [Lithospermum erythrorhizon]
MLSYCWGRSLCFRFYGGHWSPKADSILAHGYGGSFHLWKNVGVDSEHWKPQIVPSGHFASVSDIIWARCQEYILSKVKPGMMRPQVHSLSLSVQQLSRKRETTVLNYTRCSFQWCLLNHQFEEQLAWNTLASLTNSMGMVMRYFSLCCDHEGRWLLHPPKAQSASVAEIWLWQVGSWKSLGCLHSHTLTVTQMEFSHDDSFLLSVSRDRHFSVFAINQTGADNNITHELVIRQEGHKRIIWACSWNPFCHEFATGSRDKMVKIWSVENRSSVKLLITLPVFGSSVTALSWVGLNRQQNLGVLAVGMESGLIELWSISHRSKDGGKGLPVAALITRFDSFMCHVSSVNRLAWRESEKIEDSTTMHLASCGADHCVRIFKINIE